MSALGGIAVIGQSLLINPDLWVHALRGVLVQGDRATSFIGRVHQRVSLLAVRLLRLQQVYRDFIAAVAAVAVR